MAVHVSYVTDPACPWSWGAEPALRRVLAEFGDGVRITYVMGGLARQVDKPLEVARQWLEAGEGGMPVDARAWWDAPLSSTYPASLAVKAAAEQGLDGPYLRRVREGIALERRKLDNADGLTAMAREVPGMNVDRFANDLRSHAIVEAFGADLEQARAGEGLPRWEVDGRVTTDPAAVRGLIEAPSQPLPSIEEALRRFGRMATAEVAAVCDLPGPRAPAELWRLALEWRTRRDNELWVLA